MLTIRDENALKRYFLTIFSTIRRGQTTISLDTSTHCERNDVQRRSNGCKPRFLYIDFRLLGRLLGNSGEGEWRTLGAEGAHPSPLLCMCGPRLKAVPRHVAPL